MLGSKKSRGFGTSRVHHLSPVAQLLITAGCHMAASSPLIPLPLLISNQTLQMPFLFIRYFRLFRPICWTWTLSLIATKVCLRYICSFHVGLAQKADRYLVSLSSWDVFLFSWAFFRHPCPLTDTSITQPSHRELAKSNGGVTVCTNWADLSILRGKNDALFAVFYNLQCSSLEGHSAQGLSAIFRGVVDSIFHPSVPASGQPGEITFNSIICSPAVVLSLQSVIISFLPPSARAEREGGVPLRSALWLRQ